MRINGVIQRKFALMDEYLVQLNQRLQGVSRERFVEDWGLRAMTERALQVCLEIVIDVAERLLALKGAGPAASGAECINKLAALGVIKTPEPYTEMIRFRNLLVHQYEIVDPFILYNIATARLADFRRFRDEIDAALQSFEEGGQRTPSQ